MKKEWKPEAAPELPSLKERLAWIRINTETSDQLCDLIHDVIDVVERKKS